MSKDCESCQKKLVDIFYNEENMNNEVKNHIKTCHSCKEFFGRLYQMKDIMDKAKIEPSIEYAEILQSFKEVEIIKEKRRNLFDLILFIIISGVLLGLVALLIVEKYLVEIIYFQLVMYIIIPLSLPVIIKIRSLKEEYNERY